jgi:hypothetical protein
VGLELMANQLQGLSGVTWDNAVGGMRAMRVDQRCPDYGALGVYRKAMQNTAGVSWSAAGTFVLTSFRWANASNLCAVRRITIDGLSYAGTVFAAADMPNIKLFPARSFTVDTTGAGSGTFSGNTGKMRTSMGTTLAGPMTIAASTTFVTGGTYTLDTDPIGQFAFTVNGTSTNAPIVGQIDMLSQFEGNEMPLVLAQNEGFVLQFTTAATSGSLNYGMTVYWTELASY